MTFAQHVLTFYQSLSLTVKLPKGIEVMNPYQDVKTFRLCEQFYNTFYNDTDTRVMILGINPGRFGAGITGVPFTDPIKLEKYCGIANDMKKQAELSADFIYAMIEGFGGPFKFYNKFYISAISPLGFVKDGKNLNYYDVRELAEAVKPFMVSCINTQRSFGVNTRVCFCLGEGDNYKYLNKLNQEHNFFDRIEPLPHPRFIMQYKRKQVPQYVDQYVSKFRTV
jgi:hypothetical protein